MEDVTDVLVSIWHTWSSQ